jgi:N-acetylneuraminic acid mutarotase
MAQGDSRTFPETGKAVSGRFLQYWDQNGGLPQQGYPISGEMQERSDLDGKTYHVQYFERAVFEAHPENQPPFDVLLSQLGTFRYREKYPDGAPGQRANTTAGSVLFAETGKRVGGRFLLYWQQNGGLAQQGYPISEEFTERSDLDGKSYTVQYFERAVFELHPETDAPFDVLLSQLGTFRYREKYASAGATTTPSRSPTAAPGVVTGTWAEAAPMLLYRSEHGAAVLGGKIYVVGGFSGNSNIFVKVANEVEVYDPAANRWSNAAPLPDALHHLGMTATAGALYVTGGYMPSGEPVATTWVYTPANNEWRRAADMPAARAAHASVAINDKVYVIGGAGDVSTSLWEYDPATDRWRTGLPAMSVAREHLAAAALDGKLYVVGGRFPGNTTALEVYDPAANRWSRLADMPTPRGGFTAAAVGGRIHAFGGEQLTGGQVIGGHDVYDPATNRWQSVGGTPLARHGLPSVELGGKWFVLGGGTSAGGETFRTLTNRVDVFTPSSR